MKRFVIGNAVVFGIVALTASAVGCSQAQSTPGSDNGQQGPSAENTGSVGMQLTLPGGLQINTISWRLSNGANTYTGNVNVAGASTISFVIPAVAPGSGYTLTLSATTTDGSASCAGSAGPFNVGARQTTVVNVALTCTTGVDAGSVVVNGTASNCATWNTLVANPTSVPVGGATQLTAAATGPDPSALTYQWSAPTGTIANPSQATTTFTCPATPGDVVITLVAGDGPLPNGVTCPASATTGQVTVHCVGSGGSDAGVDATASDASAPDASPDTGIIDASPACTQATLVPCTSAGQTCCVKCAGNASGICSPTEAQFVQHDIAAGTATVDAGEPATSCYSCLLNAGCLDDTQFSDTGNECGDLTGNFDAGASSSSLCLSTVSCVLSTSCANAASGVSNCYCGPAAVGSACASAGGNVNGACLNQETAGLGYPASDNTDMLKSFTDKTKPAGMANQIFQCATSNSCSACLR